MHMANSRRLVFAPALVASVALLGRARIKSRPMRNELNAWEKDFLHQLQCATRNCSLETQVLISLRALQYFECYSAPKDWCLRTKAFFSPFLMPAKKVRINVEELR